MPCPGHDGFLARKVAPQHQTSADLLHEHQQELHMAFDAIKSNRWDYEWSKNVLGMQFWLPFAASPSYLLEQGLATRWHRECVLLCKGNIRYLQRLNSQPVTSFLHGSQKRWHEVLRLLGCAQAW
jgi:hypothetical protein